MAPSRAEESQFGRTAVRHHDRGVVPSPVSGWQPMVARPVNAARVRFLILPFSLSYPPDRSSGHTRTDSTPNSSSSVLPTM